ncbi:MAG: formyltransferase family protein, partial [Pseudomonadota bacterium]
MSVVDILCTDEKHPVMPHLRAFAERHASQHQVRICHDRSDLGSGDFLFLISCSQIIREEHRKGYRFVLVIHSSDLPEGRGWSPQAWCILRGDDHLTVSLLEAREPVDSGRIYEKRRVDVHDWQLFDEIHEQLYSCWIELMDWALENCEGHKPAEQVGEPSHWPKRTPEDSRIDPEKTLASQFDILRISDPDRFPAFFD